MRSAKAVYIVSAVLRRKVSVYVTGFLTLKVAERRLWHG